MKEPRPDVKHLLDAKQRDTEGLRAQTEAALAAAHPRVRKEYERCVTEIQAVAHASNAPEAWCTTVIYRSPNGPLTRVEIALIQDLLQKQGWDVRLTTPLTKKRGPKAVELIYYHHHRSHDAEE